MPEAEDNLTGFKAPPARKGPIIIPEDVDLSVSDATNATPSPSSTNAAPIELGGYKGPEPTKFGDWAHKGRVSDF